MLSPGLWPLMVLATSKSLSLMAPSVSTSRSVSASVVTPLAPHGPRALLRALRRAWRVGSALPLMRAVARLWADSLRERPASRVRRMAALRSLSAWDQTVRHTPW